MRSSSSDNLIRTNLIFVDIHTHKAKTQPGEIHVRNIVLSEAEAIFSRNEGGLFSLGVHPWSVENSDENDLEQLKIWISNKCVRLVGECGLDKFAKADYNLQESFFRKQIEISEQFQKPMIIHCVGYFNEIFALKKEYKPLQKWVIHGFRSKPQLAEQALNQDIALSFGEHFNEESLKITPLDRLYIETDESNMSITEIYSKIAQIRRCNEVDLCAGKSLLNC